jgi:hypothetical protein
MTKPWVKVLEKVQLFERAHSPNESNTESSGFKINFTECIHYVEIVHEILDRKTIRRAYISLRSSFERKAFIEKRRADIPSKDELGIFMPGPETHPETKICQDRLKSELKRLTSTVVRS